MSGKKFSDKQKRKENLRGLSKATVRNFLSDAESRKYLEEHTRRKEQFTPDFDYSQPENFVKYGSAKSYYDDAVKRIYNQYPYDGSAAEKLKFYNDLTPLEQYIFDQRYPKTTGYALFSPSGWGTVTAAGNPATKEYIKFYGGPVTGTLYNTASAHTNNLKLDYSGSGNTVEFWLKKDGWTNKDTVTRFEVIFDLRTTASTDATGHRQFTLYLDGNSAATKKNIYLSDYIDGAASEPIIAAAALDTGLADIADSKWHHYAVTVEKNANTDDLTASFYVDGERKDTHITGSFWKITDWATASADTAIAHIGANVDLDIGGSDYGTGWLKLTASIDDFRFWKTARTAKQIGRNYFIPIDGGANTDSAKYYYSSSTDSNLVDLGVYYKFNEGILGDSDKDSLVLDYSGRLSNGAWTGYSSVSRHTGSAMVDSDAAKEEEPVPILYSTHSDVEALVGELEISGTTHDINNTANLYNSIPQWIREADEESQELKKLTQIIGSYLDTLYGQISSFTKIKDTSYLTGSVKQVTNISRRLLDSHGFETPELFIDADVLKEAFSRDEKRAYGDKIYDLKNLIYKNIYNNLTFINKAKGTEKAFRNLFRCYGIDDELFNINIYANNVIHKLENTYKITTTKRNAIDFSGLQRKADREAVVYQAPGSGSADYGYISTVVIAARVDILTLAGHNANDKFTVTVPTAAGGTGVEITLKMVAGAPSSATANQVEVQSAGTAEAIVANVVAAINGTSAGQIAYGAGSGDSTNGIAGITAAAGTHPRITVTADTVGAAGNTIVFTDVVGTMVAGGITGVSPTTLATDALSPRLIDADVPVTVEAEILFPKFPKLGSFASLPSLATSSLFGCHTVDDDLYVGSLKTGVTGTAGGEGAQRVDDRDFQIYAVKRTDDRTYFELTSSARFFPTLSTDDFYDVYDNSKWNFAVRIRPEGYSWSSYISSSVSSSIEFYGVNVNNGVIVNKFSVSSSMQHTYHPTNAKYTAAFLTGSNKKFYIGAHRTNFTGTVDEKSDVRFISFRYWGDYLTDDEINYHGRDPENFGRTRPTENSHVFQLSGAQKQHVPSIDTLALHWDFSSVTASAADGRFIVDDLSSGTIDERYTVGYFSNVHKNTHTGQGFAFDTSSKNIISVEFVPTARTVIPENLNSSNLVEILSTDDELHERDSRPVKHFFSIEASMYEVISRNMLNFFASIDDFNNQIGEPVHMYRGKYKGLEKLRHLFFEKIKNVPDVEKFINLYKWLDSALEAAIANLIPASANSTTNIRSIIESHVLERNKYRHKFSLVKQYVQVDNDNNLLSSLENDNTTSGENLSAGYPKPAIQKPAGNKSAGMGGGQGVNLSPPTPYRQFTAPLPLNTDGFPTDESVNALWWKQRAERDRGVLNAGSTASDTRYQLWFNVWNDMISSSYKPYNDLFDNTQTYRGGPNNKTNQKWDYYRTKFKESDVAKDGISASFYPATVAERNKIHTPFVHDQRLTGNLRRYALKAKDFSNEDSYNEIYNEDRLPFTFISSSVLTGYQTDLSTLELSAAVEDIHHDIVGDMYEIPMQGPFAEENVGGNFYRHGQLFESSSDRRVEGFRFETSSVDTIKVVNPRNIFGVYHSGRPGQVWTRDEIAKRPVVIKNIKHSGSGDFTSSYTRPQMYFKATNYFNDYEIVSTAGRYTNNRYFVATTGSASQETNSTFLSWDPKADTPLVREFTLPTRDTKVSGNHVIATRFSSRGGASAEGEAFLDVESAEFSPYNALPYQNLIVQGALRTLRQRHCGPRGADSFFDTFAYGLAEATQSFHKVPRNSVLLPRKADSETTDTDGDDASTATARDFRDNDFVTHQIPRADVQYRWINSAWIVTKTSSVGDVDTGVDLHRTTPHTTSYGISFDDGVTSSYFSPLYGFDFTTGSDSITFLSQSEFGIYFSGTILRQHFDPTYGGTGRYFGVDWQDGDADKGQFIPVDFAGLNTIIYDKMPADIAYKSFTPYYAIGTRNGNLSEYNMLGHTSDIFGSDLGGAELESHDYPIIGGGQNLLQVPWINQYFVQGRFYDSEQDIEQVFLSDLTSGSVRMTASAPRVLNSILLNRNGPFQHPSWKQIRGYESKVIRFHRNFNIYESHRKVFNAEIDKTIDEITRIMQSPVTSKHKPIEHVLSGAMIKYELGNDYHFFGKTYVSSSTYGVQSEPQIYDYNNKFDTNVETIEDSLLYDFADNENLKWKSFKYSETVWPKDENVYRAIIRDRPNYISQWNDDPNVRKLNGYGLRQSQGKIDWISFWPMDVINYFEDAGYDRSGELMQIDNPLYAADLALGYVFLPNYAAIGGSGGDYIYARYGRNYGDNRPENTVQTTAGTGAFYNSYDDFVVDVRAIGKEYSVIPEFKITDYIRTIGETYNFDFYQNIYKVRTSGAFGDAAGPYTPEALEYSQEKFAEVFSHSDTMTHLADLKEKFGEPDSISVTMNGILKLLPIDGFYPVQRTLQLAAEFSQSYGPSQSSSFKSPNIEDASWRTVLRPFYMPGIMYNAIKTGVAVDYPVIDAELHESMGLDADGRRASGSCLKNFPKRLPFEAILEPEFYTRRAKGSASVSSPTFLEIYDYDTEYGMEINATGTIKGTDNIYELHAHNFFAEVADFFVDGLTTVSSKPESEWNFKGPMSSSDGIRMFVMNINIEKSDNFTMHDGVGYFGHHPYKHHVPPWYGLKIGTNKYWKLACSSSYHISSGTHGVLIPPAAAHSGNMGVMEIKFDPTHIYNMDPERFFAGKFTFKDIIGNSTIQSFNNDMAKQFDEPAAQQQGMPLTASINLFNKDKEDRWVIGSKWETPILNFANVYATASSGAGDGHQGGHPIRGMWHQFGEECTGSQGLFMKISDAQIPMAGLTTTGSLADACGFSNTLKRLGRTKPQKTLREALVAIPFFIKDNGQEQFFEIPFKQFEDAYNDLEQAASAAKAIKKKGEELILSVENSISDMINKMRKYNMLPQYNFVKIRDKKQKPLYTKLDYEPAATPFAMYIFEFSAVLSRTDLNKIWQGVLPEIGLTAEKQDITLKHLIKDGELISPTMLKQLGTNGKVPAGVRWKIFKIKRKAANNYFQMIEEHYNLPENTLANKSKLLSADYGANWPYDFCSLVELGKMEVGFEFENEEKIKMEMKKEVLSSYSKLTTSKKLDKQLTRQIAKQTNNKQGKTSVDEGHDHDFVIDAQGNGRAAKTCHPDSDQVCHEHKVVNGHVLQAQSNCYPNCKQRHGVPGAAPHIHKLLIMTGSQNTGMLRSQNSSVNLSKTGSHNPGNPTGSAPSMGGGGGY